MNEPIMDLIKTKFVENSMRMDETHKTLIKILEVLVEVNKKLEKVGIGAMGYDKWHQDDSE